MNSRITARSFAGYTLTAFFCFLFFTPHVFAATPAVISGMPTGSITNAFTQTTISVSTDIGSYCRYSTIPNTPYESMTGMFNAGQYLGHQATVTGLVSGNTYTYYVRCADNTNKNPSTVDFPITFSLTAVAPLVTAEPGYDPGVDHLVMQDNMDEYTDIDAMGALPVGTVPRIIPEPSPLSISQPVDKTKNQIVTGRGGTGSALRMVYPPPDGAQHSANFGTFNTANQPASATHFWQYWARVTPSSPLGGSVLAVKWFEAWHAVDRVQWNTHDHLGCPTYSHQTYWQVYDKSKGTFCQGDQPVGPYMNENISDGNWHRFTYEYKPNSAAGARDGISRMWIDGTKIIDISISAVGVVPPGGEWPWSNMDDLDALAVNDPILNVAWGSAQTTLTPAWTYDIDDFTWWTGTDASPYIPPVVTTPPPTPPITPPSSGPAPQIVSSGPSGTYPSNTSGAILSVTTNVNATCKYSTTAGTSFASMSAFATTGGILHSNTLSTLSPQTYNYYVKCADQTGNTSSTDYPITFTISGTPTTPDTTTPVTPPPADPLAAVIALILDNRPLFTKAQSLGIVLPPLIQKVLDSGTLTQADLDGTSSVQITTPTQTTTTPSITSTGTSHTTLSLSSITRPLKLNYVGTDVILLQNFLIQTNAGPQAKLLATHGANGSFGPLTQSALQEYQRSVGLPQTGVVDGNTKAQTR